MDKGTVRIGYIVILNFAFFCFSCFRVFYFPSVLVHSLIPSSRRLDLLFPTLELCIRLSLSQSLFDNLTTTSTCASPPPSPSSPSPP